MKYKQNFNNHLKALIFHLVGTILMILCLAVLNFQRDMFFIFKIIWVIYTLPVLYLHLEYYLYNRNQQIDINYDSIQITRNEILEIYPVSDLSKILVYKSASLDKSGIQILPLESYFYARILTKNDKEIIITCLMAPNLEDILKQLNGVPYERKKRFFCSINPI